MLVLTHAQQSPPDGLAFEEYVNNRVGNLQNAARREAGLGRHAPPVHCACSFTTLSPIFAFRGQELQLRWFGLTLLYTEFFRCAGLPGRWGMPWQRIGVLALPMLKEKRFSPEAPVPSGGALLTLLC